ncbi:hypothetical protein SAMN04488515_1118 [Cognatiyoonia koreensis]|uniref:Uncharacterized protein n=2 Tax=Cognatiyoonia koreensis TaxID=364200 RepID=A0A1I0PBC7_9RHOB|nr:hypothetical protein SAMN04488515_1118 [Cognatiyoonia koreensis]
MTLRSLSIFVLLAGCSTDANHIGNPLLLPISGFGTAVENQEYTQRRGRVELAVKTNYPEILNEIRSGDGPSLRMAMDAAQVPVRDRPARITQLQGDLGLYSGNPGALVTALMVYGT